MPDRSVLRVGPGKCRKISAESLKQRGIGLERIDCPRSTDQPCGKIRVIANVGADVEKRLTGPDEGRQTA